MYKIMRRIRLLIFSYILLPLASFAATYPLPTPGNDVIGRVYTVTAERGDTISTLGMRYGMSLHEMLEANPGTSMSHPLPAGKKLVVPAQFILPPHRQGIVVNMAELRLYYFTEDGKYVMTFPVAMGRDQWRTPTLNTKVISKEANPVWHVPASIQAYALESRGEVLPDEVQPGPDNPLGPYALHLAAWGYLIHGNNDPSSIGKFVSSGCIRMNNNDITTLYSMVKIGTPVYITHLPNELGWFNGNLYLKSQLPVELPGEEPGSLGDPRIQLEENLQNLSAREIAVIDWNAVNQAINQHLGIPEQIGHSVVLQQSAANRESQPPQLIEEAHMME